MKKYLSILFQIALISVASAWENYSYSLEGIEKKTSGLPNLCTFDKANPQKISCELEKGTFLSRIAQKQTAHTDQSNLRIVEYNIDRNGRGGDGPNEQGIEGIVKVLQQFQPIDVIILNEVARDCPQWENVNGAKRIAELLKMDWAYSVEFLETNEELLSNGYQCSIGNAILSSKPLADVSQKVFKSQCCLFSERAGGRVALKANIPALGITAISTHLESGSGFSDFSEAIHVRDNQSKELVSLINANESKNNLVIMAGDLNSPLKQFSQGEAFKCFHDSFSENYSWPNRNTCIDNLGLVGLSALDYIYLRNHEKYTMESQICKEATCEGFSDHYPLKLDLKVKK